MKATGWPGFLKVSVDLLVPGPPGLAIRLESDNRLRNSGPGCRNRNLLCPVRSIEVCPIVLVVSNHPDETFDAPVASSQTAQGHDRHDRSAICQGAGSVIGVAGYPRHPRTSNPGRGVQQPRPRWNRPQREPSGQLEAVRANGTSQPRYDVSDRGCRRSPGAP